MIVLFGDTYTSDSSRVCFSFRIGGVGVGGLRGVNDFRC